MWLSVPKVVWLILHFNSMIFVPNLEASEISVSVTSYLLELKLKLAEDSSFCKDETRKSLMRSESAYLAMSRSLTKSRKLKTTMHRFASSVSMSLSVIRNLERMARSAAETLS